MVRRRASGVAAARIALASLVSLAVLQVGDVTAQQTPPPTATTYPPSQIRYDGAALHGHIDPRGGTAYTYFQVRGSEGFTRTTDTARTEQTARDITQQITGLAPETDYTVQFVASGTAGEHRGEAIAFRTPKTTSEVLEADLAEIAKRVASITPQQAAGKASIAHLLHIDTVERAKVSWYTEIDGARKKIAYGEVENQQDGPVVIPVVMSSRGIRYFEASRHATVHIKTSANLAYVEGAAERTVEISRPVTKADGSRGRSCTTPYKYNYLGDEQRGDLRKIRVTMKSVGERVKITWKPAAGVRLCKTLIKNDGQVVKRSYSRYGGSTTLEVTPETRQAPSGLRISITARRK